MLIFEYKIEIRIYFIFNLSYYRKNAQKKYLFGTFLQDTYILGAQYEYHFLL